MQDPYRDATATQAPDHAKPPVVAAHHNRTARYRDARFANCPGQRCHLDRSLPFWPRGLKDLLRASHGSRLGGVASDSEGERARGKRGARHEPHERTKAPGGRRAQEMESRHRGLEARVELREPVDSTNGFQKTVGKERVTGYVDSIPGREQNVIDTPLGRIVELEGHPAAHPYSGNHRSPRPDRDPLEAGS